MPIDIEDRFWSFVNKTDTCWLWTGGKDKNGYCTVKYNGKTTKVHRVVWILTYGIILEDYWILHHCDNPPCVNPDHLYLGTRQDNTEDMLTRHRSAAGSHNGQSTLTEQDIQNIRTLYKTRQYTQKELADIFLCSQGSISRIVLRWSWQHVT